MPWINDADFAQFQQLKGGGSGGAPAAGGTPGAALKTWDPQRGWQGGAPSSPGLPGPRDIGGGHFDYTEQNAEIARRSRAAMDDPNSPTYVSPEQRARQGAANAMQAKANPGWTWNEAAGGGGYWTADQAHNNASGLQAFQNSWTSLGKANPEAFDVPLDAQGRPIDNRTGEAMPGSTTAAQRAQPAGAPQWTPPPGAPPQPTQASTGAPPQSMADVQRAATSTSGQSPSAAPAASAATTPTWTPPTDDARAKPPGWGYGYSATGSSLAPRSPGGTY